MFLNRSIHVVITLVTLGCCLGLVGPQQALGDGDGQADLDAAMVQRLDASSTKELEAVTKLLKSALEKGLDDENAAFAKQMLAGIALDRGKAIAQQMFSRPRSGNLQQLRNDALESLRTATTNDPSLAEAHLLIARLEALPGGSRERAREAADSAIEALQDAPVDQSEAYMLRAMMEQDPEKQLADVNKAIELNDKNTDAYQARSMLYFRDGKVDEAVQDLKHLLELDPTNTRVTATAVRALTEMDRLDEAMKILDDGLKAKPEAALYILRAAILQSEEKIDEALLDLNKAIELAPKDPSALLGRAQIYLGKGDAKKARQDLDKAMELKPDSVQGVLLRAYVSAEEGRLPDAINDMKMLVRSFPENASWAIQLASFYQLDNRPRKAIEVTTDVVRREPDNWQALRIRGDSRLSIGEHSKAIEDYEQALKTEISIDASKAGILNNLSWVLSTSPDDNVRDGDRAIKYGEEAAKLTEYKQAHILSTLAAGYAEKGDFDSALKWSKKAVKLGEDEDHAQLEQLKLELDSYKNKKPWREEQTVEENKAPIFSADDIIDT